MIVNLDGTIDTAMQEKLAAAYNQQEVQGGLVNIYFSSGGGSIPDAEAIIDMINKNGHITTLTVYNCIMSSAIHVFFKAQCSKSLLPGSYGMVHLPSWQTNVQSGGYMDDQSRFRVESMKAELKEYLDFLGCIGVSKKEIDEVLEGKDVYLSNKRLNAMQRKCKL